jgi:hypothetical protein
MKRFKLSNILCALVLGMVSLSSFVPLAQATDCIVHIGAVHWIVLAPLVNLACSARILGQSIYPA